MDILHQDISDPRDAIWFHIQKTGATVTWLASQTNSSRSHILRVIKKERPLHDDLLAKINEALGTDFKNEQKPITNG